MLHAETVTVRRVTTGDGDADGVPARTVVEQTINGCTVQPRTTKETVDQTDLVTARWLVSTTDPQDWISATDTVLWRGVEYHVEGRPQTFWSVLPHTEFTITETKG